MSDSNQLLRNRINFTINNMLNDKLMRELQTYFKELKPLVKNQEDALLGFVFGYMSADATAFLGVSHIAITDEKTNIIMDVFIKRILDVKKVFYKNLEKNKG